MISIMVWCDKLDYTLDATSPAASLLETKILLNSIIYQSIQGYRFNTLVIKDTSLQTDVKDNKYM